MAGLHLRRAGSAPGLARPAVDRHGGDIGGQLATTTDGHPRSATRRRLRGAPWCAKIGLWLLLLAVGAVTSREDEDAGHEDLTTISLELRRNSQRSKSSNVLEAVATVAFEASVTAPSVNPTRVPDLTTVPVAVSRPLLSRTALR
jgi:hypothetical protein